MPCDAERDGHIEFVPKRLDSDLEETRHQITAWADRQIVKSRWESQFAAMRGMSTDGCMISFFFAFLALAQMSEYPSKSI